jgi:hypothetical protein
MGDDFLDDEAEEGDDDEGFDSEGEEIGGTLPAGMFHCLRFVAFFLPHSLPPLPFFLLSRTPAAHPHRGRRSGFSALCAWAEEIVVWANIDGEQGTGSRSGGRQGGAQGLMTPLMFELRSANCQGSS